MSSVRSRIVQLSDSIDRLELAPRTHQALLRANITTVGALLQAIENHSLPEVDGIGSKGLAAIEERVAQVEVAGSAAGRRIADQVEAEVAHQVQAIRAQIESHLLHPEAKIAGQSVAEWLS